MSEAVVREPSLDPSSHASLAVRPSALDGVGLFATRPIAIGEIVTAIEGLYVAEPTRLTVQVNRFEHIDPAGAAWGRTNHCCAPNCRLDLDDRALVAIAPIAVGEEVTWNYLTTEWSLASSFACRCGAPSCVDVVRGLQHLRAEQVAAIMPHVKARSLRRWRAAHGWSIMHMADDALADAAD